MNIQAIGWGILASVVSLFLLKLTSKTYLENKLSFFLSFLIGLAATLIIW